MQTWPRRPAAGYDLKTEQAEALVNDLTTLAGAALAFYGRLKAVQLIKA